jgi:hypothetical protein
MSHAESNAQPRGYRSCLYFQTGTFYSQSMIHYMDEIGSSDNRDGFLWPGIGAVITVSPKKKNTMMSEGPFAPQVAPYPIHLIHNQRQGGKRQSSRRRLYAELQQAGCGVV